ncbi:(3,5-dihydroxyphenyl)acetyl-CoA 1,2-dioxygenase DpgC [Dactylosporangium sp. CA-092794]|uniref:(3,5-dihydroxyphenyl)acetyl-CoA 1,2-dioxygenase DpgC n=1 Tax=Dactylosporangium sp. CA-092794 TaxID=3239929 RepID=UPI003D8E2179
MTLTERLNRWIAAEPALRGSFPADRLASGGYLCEADGLLDTMPPRPARDGDQQAAADLLHDIARRVRAAFFGRHAERVYDELTDGTTTSLRLAELADLAGQLFPGLVPSTKQVAADNELAQRDKEGREIDLGILFSALLAAPAAGEHLMTAMLRPTPRALELLADFQRTDEIVLEAARLDRRGTAGHVTITNGHCLNAEDNRHVADMETLVDVVLLDPRVRVGVLRGGVMTHPRYAGRRVFSAGINLRDLHAGKISYVDFLLTRELGYLSKIFRGLAAPAWSAATVQKPWLAAVDSFAIGGGAQILLVCDWVVAAGDAYFSLPAAQEGIVPGLAGLRLTRFLGASRARAVILDGARIAATDASARTIFDEIAGPPDMDAAVTAAADRLAAPAVAANRRLLNQADEPVDQLRNYLATFALHQALRVYAPDVLAKEPRRR